jgi:hypothetical protein
MRFIIVHANNTTGEECHESLFYSIESIPPSVHQHKRFDQVTHSSDIVNLSRNTKAKLLAAPEVFGWDRNVLTMCTTGAMTG